MVFGDAAECLFLIVIAQEMVQYYGIWLYRIINFFVFVRSGKENVKPLKEVVEHVEQMDVEEEAKVEELAIAFSTQRLDVEDIDAQDSDNPQLVSEYVNDIYKYLRELEVQTCWSWLEYCVWKSCSVEKV